MNNSLIAQRYINNQENEQIKMLKDLIQEIGSLRTEPAWGAKYKVWSQRVEKLLETKYGSNALQLFNQQSSVEMSDHGFLNELNERKKILEAILVRKDEFITNTKPTYSFHKKVYVANLSNKVWYEVWWGQIVIGLIVLILGAIILKMTHLT